MYENKNIFHSLNFQNSHETNFIGHKIVRGITLNINIVKKRNN
jgi:hypothetical protein